MIVTICGSMRFFDQMLQVAADETAKGRAASSRRCSTSSTATRSTCRRPSSSSPTSTATRAPRRRPRWSTPHRPANRGTCASSICRNRHRPGSAVRHDHTTQPPRPRTRRPGPLRLRARRRSAHVGVVMSGQPISWFRGSGERPVGGNTVWTKPVDDEPEFFISSFCNSGECVAVAFMRQSKTVLVRHHRSGDGGPTLEFSTAEWDAFIAGVRRGEFDVPGAPVDDDTGREAVAEARRLRALARDMAEQ